ncbi:zinc finger protein family member, putative [Trypanosoma equiperdum]|uniref:Zinc finger protein family member, putative n=1 Tax=Trypanosoma equiperdum TaxID=5694 RepID=A0A1G4IC98_TRYEQ|nr:zinc finger protein family member, putative [Trypanosoma equiperdum]
MGRKDDAIKKLISLNFSKSKATEALKEANGDFDVALRILQNKKVKEQQIPVKSLAEKPKLSGNDDRVGDGAEAKQRKHPCIVQYKKCQYGKFCRLRDYPGDVCINYFNGTCLYGNFCKRRHYVDGVDIRADQRPETSSGIVKHQSGTVRISRSCGNGVFVGDVIQCVDEESSSQLAGATPEPCRFNLIQGSEPTYTDPRALDWQSRATSVIGTTPTPFLDAVRQNAQKQAFEEVAPTSPVPLSVTSRAISRNKHPCIAQRGCCKYGKNCLHADRDADVCVFFLNGRCAREGSCKYRHESDAEYLRRVRPDLWGGGCDDASQGGETVPLTGEKVLKDVTRARWCQADDGEVKDGEKYQPTGVSLSDFLPTARVDDASEGGTQRGEHDEDPMAPDQSGDNEFASLLSLIEAFPSAEPYLLLHALRCADGNPHYAADVINRVSNIDSTEDIDLCFLASRLEDEDEEKEAAIRDKHEWFLTLCTLFPGVDTPSIQAVLDRCGGEYGEAYDILLCQSGSVTAKAYGTAWSGKVKGSEEARVEKLCGMYPGLPKDVVQNAFGTADGNFLVASGILNDMTKDMLVAGDVVADSHPCPARGKVVVTTKRTSEEDEPKKVSFQFPVSSPSREEVEAFYNSVKNEVGELGDWRRVREQAYIINSCRIRVLKHAAAAYRRGDGEAAKTLSRHGKELGAQYQRLNRIAMVALERERLYSSPVVTLDLHGFHVEEAIEVVRRRVKLCQQKGVRNLQIVTGSGKHSRGGNSALHSAVLKQLQEDTQLDGIVKIGSIKPAFFDVQIAPRRK